MNRVCDHLSDKQEIFVIEPLCHGYEHVNFNLAFLLAVKKAFPDFKITFFSEKNHSEYLLDSIKFLKLDELQDINFELFNPIERGCIDRKRFLFERKELKRIFKSSSSNSLKYVFFTACTSSTIANLKTIYKKFKCYTVVHSIMDTLDDDEIEFKEIGDYFTFSKLVSKVLLFKNCFRYLNSKKLKYILLSDHIKDNIPCKKVIPYCLFANLPYFFKEKYDKPLFEEKKLRIGYIGYISNTKGFNVFLDVVKHINSLNIENSPEFVVVGGGASQELLSEVKTIKNLVMFNTHLPYDQMLDEISKLDYALFMYPSYALKFSAAFLDALSMGIPVIALRNPMFDFVFQKMGNVGYLNNSKEEIIDTILSLQKRKPIEEYKINRENIYQKRTLFSIENFSKTLKESALTK